MTINAGAVQIPADGTAAGTSKVQSLMIIGTGLLDLTNNNFILDYTGATPVNNVRLMLKSGVDSGIGIASSLAATGSMMLGYADNAVLGLSTFGGQTVDSTSILIGYTLIGDTNLDGTVNVTDLANLAKNFGSGANWTGGDFNYDGVCNVVDLADLAGNFGQSVGGTATSAAAAIAVPEPSLLSSIGVLALSMIRRRRR
jgi:hypothetical protein